MSVRRVIVVIVINFISRGAFNIYFFKKLCSDMNLEHDTLLFCTKVRWLFRGNILSRLYPLREEVKLFLTDNENKRVPGLVLSVQLSSTFALFNRFFAKLNCKLHLQLQLSGDM